MARVCRDWKPWVQAHIADRFDINRFLRRFFDDTIGFRRLQASHNAVFSGSQVLDFLGGFGFASCSDGDIYVQADGVADLACFFFSQGYSYAGEDWVSARKKLSSAGNYSGGHILGVLTFSRPTPTCRSIDLVVVRHDPLHAITQFHSSELRWFSCGVGCV